MSKEIVWGIDDLLPSISKKDIHNILTKWVSLVDDEQQEMNELADSFEKKYWQLRGRIGELIKKLLKEEK